MLTELAPVVAMLNWKLPDSCGRQAHDISYLPTQSPRLPLAWLKSYRDRVAANERSSMKWYIDQAIGELERD